jgi:hypothetical protein
MGTTKPSFFQTPKEVEHYFGGKTIACLLCGREFRRLWKHLSAKHDMTVDGYRKRFGLPWSRGLTCAASSVASGWTTARKKKARKLAKQSRFFELAHLTPRRDLAPFLRAQAVQNLGQHAVGLGEVFEQRVRALFDKGLTDANIAQQLGVGRATVTYRTMHWRKLGHKQKASDLR